MNWKSKKIWFIAAAGAITAGIIIFLVKRERNKTENKTLQIERELEAHETDFQDALAQDKKKLTDLEPVIEAVITTLEIEPAIEEDSYIAGPQVITEIPEYRLSNSVIPSFLDTELLVQPEACAVINFTDPSNNMYEMRYLMKQLATSTGPNSVLIWREILSRLRKYEEICTNYELDYMSFFSEAELAAFHQAAKDFLTINEKELVKNYGIWEIAHTIA